MCRPMTDTGLATHVKRLLEEAWGKDEVEIELRSSASQDSLTDEEIELLR